MPKNRGAAKKIKTKKTNLPYYLLGLCLLGIILPLYLINKQQHVTTEAAVASQLQWKPPVLTNPTTITVSAANHNLVLDQTKDYIIKMPSTPLQVTGGVTTYGGHNVVLIGGEIQINTALTANNAARGLKLQNWTGTMHVEGLWISGSTLTEGIDVDTRTKGSILQLENIRVETVHGTRSTNHADVVQTWGGPDILRVDHLTGSTTYQGFFLDPYKFAKWYPTKFEIMNTNIEGVKGGYLYYQIGNFPLVATNNVWAETSPTREFPRLVLWGPNWGGVQKVKQPFTDFVPLGIAGVNYKSPGYVGEPTKAVAPTNTIAPSLTQTPYITLAPTFYCLGGCPSPQPSPTQEMLSPSPVPTQVIPTEIVRQPDPTKVPQQPRQNNNGFFAQLFALIFALFQMLLQTLKG